MTNPFPDQVEPKFRGKNQTYYNIRPCLLFSSRAWVGLFGVRKGTLPV